MSLQSQLAVLRSQLQASLIERDAEIDATILGLIAREHVLLVGPPGTAKSTLCTSLCAGIAGSTAFPYLLNKFTKPDELFGAIDVLAMANQGRYCRLTAGKLPSCHLAFIDEIWKASSAILNTMLTIMQERVFDNDNQRQPCPLRMMIAASNEWPGGEGQEDLGALFDRFLIRKSIKPVSDGALPRLLFDALPPVTPCIDLADIDLAHAEAMRLPFSDAATDALLQIIGTLKDEGVFVGDRRKRKSIKVAQAAAWIDGASEVQPKHLEALSDVLWEDPVAHPEKVASVVLKVSNPMGSLIQQLLAEVGDMLAKPMTNPAETAMVITQMKECEQRAQAYAVSGNGRGKAALAYIREQRSALAQRLLART